MSVIEKTIAVISPSWAAKRNEVRRLASIRSMAIDRLEQKMQRTYDAADKDRLRGDSWISSKIAVNAALEQDLAELWSRAEDLARNDCYASAAVNARVDNVVGRGLRFQSRIKAVEGILDETRAKRLNQQIEEQVHRWMRLDENRTKQREFERSKAVYGEGIAIWSDSSEDRDTIPLTWEVIDPRRVETPPEYAGDRLVRLGIRFTDETYSTPVIYYVLRMSPGDTFGEYVYDEVPSERVQHSFERQFPGQIRGIPWLTPAMTSFKDLKDFREAKLISEQVSCCTTAFIKTADPIARQMGASLVDNVRSGKRIEELAPGTVEYLQENEDIVFADPNRPGTTMEPFMSWYLRGISAAIRLPYELLCKHFGNSFAGGRLALSDGKLTFQLWQQDIQDDALYHVYMRIIEELVTLGRVEISPDEFLIHRHVFCRHAWVPQGWPYAVNPQQEAQANVTNVQAGFATETSVISDRGEDFDETVEARSRERIRRLEADAVVERRRQELATELNSPSFGVVGAVPQSSEPVEQEQELEVAA